MARPNWLNENSTRAFPFITGEEFTPDEAIVDFGCFMGRQSGYVEGQHWVRLTQVERVGNVFRFTFHSDAPGCDGLPLVFTRTLSDVNATEFVSSGLPDVSLSVGACDDEPVWSGYLVTGDLGTLAERLPGDGSIGGYARVEPALVKSTSFFSVRSINVANDDRTRWHWYDPSCSCWATGVISRPVWVEPNGSCMTGHVRFREGYNCTIEQRDAQNGLIFHAEVKPITGIWTPPPLEHFVDGVYVSESTESRRGTYDGAPSCGRVFTTINGVSAKDFWIEGGRGVTVTPYPTQHAIVINVDLHDVLLATSLSVSPTEDVHLPNPNIC